MNLLAYNALIDPLPIWVNPWFWPLLLLPLCLFVAVVYRTIKCDEIKKLPREAAEFFVYIVGGMALAAGALALLAAWMR